MFHTVNHSCFYSDILAFLQCLAQKTYTFDDDDEEKTNLRSSVAIFLNVEFTHFGEHFWPRKFWPGNGQALLETLGDGNLLSLPMRSFFIVRAFCNCCKLNSNY